MKTLVGADCGSTLILRCLLALLTTLIIPLASGAQADNKDPIQKLLSEAASLVEGEKYIEAIRVLDRAVRLDPTNASVLVVRGSVQLKAKRYRDAVSDCDNALQLNPTNREARECRASANMALGRKAQAANDLAVLSGSATGSALADSASGLEVQAYMHLTNGELPQALEKINAALKSDEKRPGAYAIRGQVQEKMGRFMTALNDYSKSLELQSSEPVQELRALLLAKIGQHDKAVADWTELIRRNPIKTDYLILRAKSYQLMGDRNRANVDLYQAMRISPAKSALIAKLQQATDATTIQNVSSMLVTSKPTIAPPVPSAAPAGTPAVAPAEPIVAEVRRNPRKLARRTENSTEPKLSARINPPQPEPATPAPASPPPASPKALEPEPAPTPAPAPANSPQDKLLAKLNEASALLRAGKTKEAISAYTEAIAIRSDFASVYADRGAAFAKLGSFKEAADDYGKATELEPKNLKAWLGRCSARIEIGSAADAISDCNEVLKSDPKSVDALLSRGRAFVATNRIPDAIQDLTAAAKLRYDLPDAHLQLGRLYAKTNELVLSLHQFTLALQKKPALKEAYKERAEVRLSLGDALGHKDDLSRAEAH